MMNNIKKKDSRGISYFRYIFATYLLNPNQDAISSTYRFVVF